MNRLKTNILTALYKAVDGLTEKELIKLLDLPKKMAKKLSNDLADMKKFGDISNKKGVWRLKNAEDYFTAVITRVTQIGRASCRERV